MNTASHIFIPRLNKKSAVVFPALACVFILLFNAGHAQKNAGSFSWPQGKQAALSLSFDDARESQVVAGTHLLDQYGIKATFFVNPSGVERQLDGWKKAVASGHEIGNHTLTHPCSGNFSWSRDNALEDHSLKSMRQEMMDCNKRIKELLHIQAEVFAYPCGQKFVGRGVHTKSYVPLVAKMFFLGRGWMDEAPNDPLYCNFPQLTGVEMDGKTFDQIRLLLEQVWQKGQWLVLAGNEIDNAGEQTTLLSMLKQLMEYVQDPINGYWNAPMGTVAGYIKTQ